MDCQDLVDRARKRMNDWKNKTISYAARLQLVASVLSSMQVYLASILFLPIAVNKEIDRILNGFLWSQGELTKKKAKLSWKSICRLNNQ